MDRYALYIDAKKIGCFVNKEDALKFRDISGGKYYHLYTCNEKGINVETIEGLVPSPKPEPKKISQQDIFVATVQRDGTVSLVTKDAGLGPFSSETSWVASYNDHEVVAVSFVSPREAVLKATEFIKQEIDENAAKGGACFVSK